MTSAQTDDCERLDDEIRAWCRQKKREVQTPRLRWQICAPVVATLEQSYGGRIRSGDSAHGVLHAMNGSSTRCCSKGSLRLVRCRDARGDLPHPRRGRHVFLRCSESDATRPYAPNPPPVPSVVPLGVGTSPCGQRVEDFPKMPISWSGK